MKIIDVDKDFLEVAHCIFMKLGYGNAAYEDIGFLFADFFMDALADIHIEVNKDESKFISLTSIDAIKPSGILYGV